MTMNGVYISIYAESQALSISCWAALYGVHIRKYRFQTVLNWGDSCFLESVYVFVTVYTCAIKQFISINMNNFKNYKLICWRSAVAERALFKLALRM